MNLQNLKPGTIVKKVAKTELECEFSFIVTSVTEKRVNCDNNIVSFSSTGRGSSKFYYGVKSFSEYLNSGSFVIISEPK